MQQKRLIIALLIATAILFAWSYFVPTKPPEPAPAPAPATQPSPQPTATPQSTPVSSASPSARPSPAESLNAAPHRVVSIKTPLYEAKLDSLGGEATSWII